MLNKKVILGISAGLILTCGICLLLLSKNDKTEDIKSAKNTDSIQPSVTEKVVSKPAIKNNFNKKTNLYNLSDKNIPFSAIADLAVLPEIVQKTVNNVLENSDNGIYFLAHSQDKVILLTGLTSEEEENSIKRHDFDFIEISLQDGQVINHQDCEKDSQFDTWEYENDLPINHFHYDDNNELVYTEVWNYSETEPVKYKKIDKEGSVISLKKEVVDNGTNLREEHIFYDSKGNMTKNVSFNYNGTDLTRFTYYDSSLPESSAMIVSEYEDGVKLKESLYSSDYKLKNTYVPKYVNGQKSELSIFDEHSNLVETYSSVE